MVYKKNIATHSKWKLPDLKVYKKACYNESLEQPHFEECH